VIEVIFLTGAESDVQALYEERDSFREGTGDRFLRVLDRCASLLGRYPRIGRRHRGDRVGATQTSRTPLPFPKLDQAELRRTLEYNRQV